MGNLIVPRTCSKNTYLLNAIEIWIVSLEQHVAGATLV